ncbi:MAG: AsmA-like C-terminal region-containing protein [Bacteroidota bacterium]
MKKVLKKIALYSMLLVITIVTATAIATYLYKDQLIDHFIREANKNLDTLIQVEKISVSAFDNFPQITLVFEEVIIEESYKNSSYPLLEAGLLEFTFNIWNLIEGQYLVEEVHITDAKCDLKVDESGRINYSIFKSKDSKSNGMVAFDLSKVLFDNVDFKYSNQIKSARLEIQATEAEASISARNQLYKIGAKGLFYINTISLANRVWATEKELDIEAEISYNDSSKSVIYSSKDFILSKAKFLVNGSYDFLTAQTIDLNVSGKNADIQTLLSLLSAQNQSRFKKYKSNGEVYFDLSLNGEISAMTSPSLKVDFGLKECTLIYPDNDVAISGASAIGSFTAADLSKPSTYGLRLRETQGKLENRSFLANMDYENFDDPYLKLDLEGEFDINSVFDFYELKDLEEASGDLLINMTFEGRLNDLKSKSGTKGFKTSGDILMKDLFVSLNTLRLPLSKLNGNLLFNNNDLALSEVEGYLGNSHFKLNGFFKNILAYVFFENEPVGIESQLESDFINMDELLSSDGEASDQPNYAFFLSPNLRLKFSCDVKELKFRRLKARNIIGDLKIKDQLALTDKLSFRTMGGKIDMAGLVDAHNQKDIKVNTSFSLDNLNIDSIFYVLENFNQSFLEDRHLRGKVQADVDASMDFDENLDLFAETLTSTISTSIQGGQLNNFEPLQRLDKYLDTDGLSKLEFSELKNDIFIENKTIYLPEMTVGSNVTDIQISGKHTFDQKIDYRLIAPLRNRKKIDKDEAFGAIEENTDGKTMLYLKILGTTSDYRVLYDKESVKNKIVSDLRKEVQELKKAFKEKGLRKEKTIELEEDDYFDWDEDGEN